MGTYTYGEYLETFGGTPDPGETYPDDPDAARDERDAALEAAMFNDVREQERLSHDADLRHEYSGPEYDDHETEDTT